MTYLTNQFVSVLSPVIIATITKQLYQVGFVIATAVLSVRVLMVGYEKVLGNDTTTAKYQLKEAIVPCAIMYTMPYLFQYVKVIAQLLGSLL